MINSSSHSPLYNTYERLHRNQKYQMSITFLTTHRGTRFHMNHSTSILHRRFESIYIYSVPPLKSPSLTAITPQYNTFQKIPKLIYHQHFCR